MRAAANQLAAWGTFINNVLISHSPSNTQREVALSWVDNLPTVNPVDHYLCKTLLAEASDDRRCTDIDVDPKYESQCNKTPNRPNPGAPDGTEVCTKVGERYITNWKP